MGLRGKKFVASAAETLYNSLFLFLSTGLFPFRTTEVRAVLSRLPDEGVSRITAKERAVITHLLNREPTTLPLGPNDSLNAVDEFLMVVKAVLLEMIMLKRVTERHFFFLSNALREFIENMDALLDGGLEVNRAFLQEGVNYIQAGEDYGEFEDNRDMNRKVLGYLERAIDWFLRFSPESVNAHRVRPGYSMFATSIQPAGMGYVIRGRRITRGENFRNTGSETSSFRTQAGEVSITVPTRGNEAGTSFSIRPIARVAPALIEARLSPPPDVISDNSHSESEEDELTDNSSDFGQGDLPVTLQEEEEENNREGIGEDMQVELDHPNGATPPYDYDLDYYYPEYFDDPQQSDTDSEVERQLENYARENEESEHEHDTASSLENPQRQPLTPSPEMRCAAARENETSETENEPTPTCSRYVDAPRRVREQTPSTSRNFETTPSAEITVISDSSDDEDGLGDVRHLQNSTDPRTLLVRSRQIGSRLRGLRSRARSRSPRRNEIITIDD